MGRAGDRARPAAAEAADDRLRRERDVLHARRRLDTGRPAARHALPRRRRLGRGDRLRRADPGSRSTSARRRSAPTPRSCARASSCRRSRASPARAASSAARSGTCSARRTGRRRSRPTSRRRWCCSTVVNARDDTESVAKDVETIRSLLPGPDGEPAAHLRHRRGGLRRRPQRGGRGPRRHAAGDHRRARAGADAAHLPLAADRGADARRRGDRVPDRDRRWSTASCRPT